jgi:hypothetical protein
MPEDHDEKSGDEISRFFDLVERATSVQAIDGLPLTGKRKNLKILFVEKDPVVLEELASSVWIAPLEDIHWMMMGNPTLMLYGPDGYLLNIQPLSGDYMRSDALPSDARLLSPGGLSEWIASRLPTP